MEHKSVVLQAAKGRNDEALHLHVEDEMGGEVPHHPLQKERIVYTQTKKIQSNPAILRKNRVLSAGSRHPAVAAYKLLRTQILHKLSERNWNTLGIVSPTMGDGKTLTAINVAISLAQEARHTVMLVDLDLRKPSVHRYFGFEPEKGISDFIRHNTPIESILVNPGIPGLVLMPGRDTFDNSSEMISSPNVIKMVEEIKARYPSRIIIFDIPPVLHADDALAFSPYIDTALMVIAEGKTKQKDVVQALELLYNVPMLGTVLNKGEDVRELY